MLCFSYCVMFKFVKFGSGDWTCVLGEMEGTFSKPMPIGNGKSIPPTNKKFKLAMATIGHWKMVKCLKNFCIGIINPL